MDDQQSYYSESDKSSYYDDEEDRGERTDQDRSARSHRSSKPAQAVKPKPASSTPDNRHPSDRIDEDEEGAEGIEVKNREVPFPYKDKAEAMKEATAKKMQETYSAMNTNFKGWYGKVQEKYNL